jgi:hypothetical protein
MTNSLFKDAVIIDPLLNFFCPSEMSVSLSYGFAGAKGGTVYSTEYIFYCKRAILFLSSSKILTPHPPTRPASVLRGEDRLARRRGGWGVNILEDERNKIALLQ